ncbi:MAG: septum formation initiator family protein [Pseudomonadota bacterium]
MTTFQKIIVALAVVILFNFLLVIFFGDKGLVDLFKMKSAHEQTQQKNDTIIEENLKMAKEIERLQHGDPALIEHRAREQLGMVRPGEIVVRIHNRKQEDSGQTAADK